MALSNELLWEIRTNGSDTNGGGYASAAGVTRATNLTATSANTASPVVSSATYTFVSGDVGHWIFIRSGTNWLPGWYPIVSVSGGNATLDASLGAANVYDTSAYRYHGEMTNTVVGCASVASPTSGTWSIDYSRTSSGRSSGSNLAVHASVNTDVQPTSGHTVGPADVGNLVYIAGGGGWTAGWYQINSLQQSGTHWRLDRSPAATSTTGGTYTLGGAMASLGAVGGPYLSSQVVWIRAGAYSITSASSNVAGGMFVPSDNVTIVVRGTTASGVRVDRPSVRPTLVCDSALSNFVVIQGSGGSFASVCDVDIDCADCATSRAINASRLLTRNVVVRRATNYGIVGNFGIALQCYVTGCKTTGSAYGGTMNLRGCVAIDNEVPGWILSSTYAGCSDSLFIRNSIGVLASADGYYVNRCVFADNVSDGIQTSGTIYNMMYTDNIFVGNGGYGLNYVQRHGNMLAGNAFYGNTSGAMNGVFDTLVSSGNLNLTGDPFIDRANDDYRLNDTPGAGGACRAAGFPQTWPGLPLTTSYSAIGACEPYDPTPAEIAAAIWSYEDRSLTS